MPLGDEGMSDTLRADPELLGLLKGRTEAVGTSLQGRTTALHGTLGAVAPPALGDFLRALTAARDAHEGLLRDADSYFNDATFALASIDHVLDGHESTFSKAFGGLMEV